MAAATGKAKKKRATTKTGKPRARRGVKLKPTELGPVELPIAELPPELAPLAEAVAGDGGSVLAAYREPLGGHPQLLVALPVDKVEPTPFQRDLSDAHLLKLIRAMDKTRRYLDPIIVVREEGRYLTPNGNHRLAALRELGARAILGLLIPDPKVAYQILALNTEKAHNLREKSLEVARMYRDLAKLDGALAEADLALEFEDPSLATLGFAYEQRGRFSGGAYQAVLKRVDAWIPGPLGEALAERTRRTEVVLALDDAVTEAVARLKERGFTSPYLRAFVVARVNPLRFARKKGAAGAGEGGDGGEAPRFGDVMATMTRRARGLDPARVKSEDLARSGGAPELEE